MPASRPEAIVTAIIDAMWESGYTAVCTNVTGGQPREFIAVALDGRETKLWAYVWTLTHGGRPSLEHEFRVQMTSVRSPLTQNANGPTVLLGYEPDLKLFAGFDFTRHRTFTEGSPSVQIDRRTLHDALQRGIAFFRKSNDEIAVGVRPDLFMAYALHADDLHHEGRAADGVLALECAVADDGTAALPVIESGERRRVLATVHRLSRSAQFRQCVLDAYGHRCAVTRMQLRLIEAAHILPVIAPGSADDIRNGIAFSPTMHRAYDSGLIYLDRDYEMCVNANVVSALHALRRDDGLEMVRGQLGRIHLPADQRQWPDQDFIIQANRFRGIEM